MQSHNQSTLVGNWVEERALKSTTGTYRYREWVDISSEATLYPKETNRVPDPTSARVIAHADSLPPTAYATHTHETFRDPTTQGDKQHRRYLPAGEAVGKRTAAKMAAMMREAAAEPEVAAPKTDFTTTSAAAFDVKPRDATLPLGRRVMRTQDGVEVPTGALDRKFQAELGLVPTGRCGRQAASQGCASAAAGADTALSGVPATIYAQQPGAFPMSNPEHSANPFARTSVFSKPMTDPMKIVEE